jgi:flavorubredoxin
MRALVVYESMFGNTRLVAQAVAEGLRHDPRADVEVRSVEVRVAPAVVDDTVDVLVVGAPTHAFGLSRVGTRRDAATRGADDVAASGDGVREWLGCAVLSHRVATATFDTRIRRPRVPGSAARAAARRLRKLGGRPVSPPETFWVTDVAGPLVPGEIERAKAWGASVAASVTAVLVRP